MEIGLQSSSFDNGGTEDETVLLIPDNNRLHLDFTEDVNQPDTTFTPPVTSLTDVPLDSDDSSSLPDSPTQSSHSSTSVAERSTASETGMSGEVEFRVGKDRQLMIGSRQELESVSPVLRSLLSQSTRKEKQTIVEIPDVPTQAFGVILRCAARDNHLPLSEDTVWNVLQAAHHFQIAPVITRCFHYLLHKHPQRHKSRHLCSVLEKTHQLGYTEHHVKCLLRVKRHAGKILQSPAGLSELCHQCMTEIVTAEDLPVPEILIHGGVVTWARAALRKDTPEAEPSWEELRAIAGQLVYEVRYLAMPRPTLQDLRAEEPCGCLLSQKEKMRLLQGDARGFPYHVAAPRRKKGLLDRERVCNLVWRWRERKVLFFSIICIMVLLLVFLIAYFCSYEILTASSEPDSPVYILMFQEEKQ